MTKTVLPLTIGLLAISFLRPQEISPSPSASATPARAVRITFVPPPLEGKISLGVYNEWSQLVRVLHQEADFDEFAIGADALSTKWDGKDDYDYDLPARKYTARVYLQTIDGLPLVTVAKRQDAKSVSVAAGRDNKSVIVFLSNGTNVRQLEVSGITKMMAFDCGSFELK